MTGTSCPASVLSKGVQGFPRLTEVEIVTSAPSSAQPESTRLPVNGWSSAQPDSILLWDWDRKSPYCCHKNSIVYYIQLMFIQPSQRVHLVEKATICSDQLDRELELGFKEEIFSPNFFGIKIALVWEWGFYCFCIHIPNNGMAVSWRNSPQYIHRKQ